MRLDQYESWCRRGRCPGASGRPVESGQGPFVGLLGFLRIAGADIQIPGQAVAEFIDPAVDGDVLATLPGVADNRGLADVEDLFDDVQFAQQFDLALAIGGAGKAGLVLFPGVLHMAEPVVHQAMALVLQGGADAAAVFVAHHQDVLHVEDIHGELDDG